MSLKALSVVAFVIAGIAVVAVIAAACLVYSGVTEDRELEERKRDQR